MTFYVATSPEGLTGPLNEEGEREPFRGPLVHVVIDTTTRHILLFTPL